MPKIKPEIDIEESEEEDEADDDEFEDNDDIEEMPTRKPANLKAAVQQRQAKKEVKRRFGIVAPQSLRIVDTETNEVVGDGEFAVIQALTDILERLERIETKIGAVIN